MKTGFWAGVVSAIVAGLVLFFAQQFYSEWKTSKSVDIRVNSDAALIDGNTLSAIQPNVRGGQSVRIASFTVRNNGAAALNGETVHFTDEVSAGSTVHAFGVIPRGGADPTTVVLEPKAHGFDVTFRSLPAGGDQTFWVAHSCCAIFRASPLSPGLSVSTSISNYDVPDESWRWFERLGILIIAFIAGLIVDSAVTSKMLKRRGYNLEQILTTKPPESGDGNG